MKMDAITRRVAAPFLAACLASPGLGVLGRGGGAEGAAASGAVVRDDGTQICLGSMGTVVCVPPEPAPGSGGPSSPPGPLGATAR